MRIKHLFLVFFAGWSIASVFFVPRNMAEIPPRRIEVVAKRFSFEPGEITLKKGEPVVLVLKSVDVTHGIRFKELNVDARAGKGATTSTFFTPTRTGDFAGHCSIFCGKGHGSMTMSIHVVQ